MNGLDIKMARIMCDLLELRNITAVAKKHKLSQPTISHKLIQTEMIYKCKLINRKHRPFTFTKAGELFCDACKEILKRHEHLKDAISTLSPSPSQVNIATIFSIGMHMLKPYIKKIMVESPQLYPSVEYYKSSQIYNCILSGDINIGIVAVPEKKANIDIYPFEKEPLVLACHPGHSLANNISVDIKNLQDRDFVAFDNNTPTRKHIDSILKRYNVCVNIKKECENIEIIKRAAEAKVGICILPLTAIAFELSSGTLKAIPFSNEKLVRPTGILVKRTAELSPSVQHCLDILLKKEVPGSAQKLKGQPYFANLELV
jgi:DNA-binding transcriptional LysR family regulator